MRLSDYKAAILILLAVAITVALYDKRPLRPQTENEFIITAVAIDKNHGTPRGKSGGEPAMSITEVSNDKTYGYNPENPLNVGGASRKQGPENEVRYLNSLYGPNGESIEYERLGSGRRRLPDGKSGKELLDIYKVTYKGLKEPIFLYLNMYDYEEPKAPYGFSIMNRQDLKL